MSIISFLRLHSYLFLAVDFTTGDEPWPIFELQKEFNAPGKSPPLSAWVFQIQSMVIYSSYVLTLMMFTIVASFILVGWHTGERILRKRMLLSQQLLWKKSWKRMVQPCSMYGLQILKFLFASDYLLNIVMMYTAVLSRWHMVEQTSDFIMVQIPVQGSLTTRLILHPMIMWAICWCVLLLLLS